MFFIPSFILKFQQKMLFLALFLLLPVFAFAQEAVDFAVPADAPVTEGVEIANINLSNATILSQDATALTLEFKLENQSDKPQFDIKYGVELIVNLENGAQVVADSFVGRETLTLSARQSLSKVVNYPLSGVAPGTYSVWITARTTGGTLLGLGSAGSVSILAANVVEVKVDTCYLTVAEDDVRFNLGQGVDVSTYEDLTLSCLVKNHGITDRQVLPQFDTFRRTIFGEKIQLEYEKSEPLFVEAGAEKELKLNIPKATDPQAYDTVLTLTDVDRRSVVSNRTTIHYVIQGESATIQTVNFSKNYYVVGENIVLDFTWTDSADGFVGSRQGAPLEELTGGTLGTQIEGGVSVAIQVVDSNGVACSAKLTKKLDTNHVSMMTPATADCYSPSATVSLIGPDGGVLDSRTIVAPETVSPSEEVVPFIPKQVNALMVVTVLAFAVVLIIILFALGRRKKVEVTS